MPSELQVYTTTEFRQRARRVFRDLLPRADEALRSVLLRHGYRRRCTLADVELEIRDLGQTAGQVRGRVVTINSQLAEHPHALRGIIAHELAHVVADTARRTLRKRRRSDEWSTHGSIWVEVAQWLGDSGETCHTLPLKPVRVLSMHLYRLSDGTERVLSAIRHNRLQRNRRKWYLWPGDSEPVRWRHYIGEIPAKAARRRAR